MRHFLDINKTTLVKQVVKGTGIDEMSIAGFDNLFHHEDLERPGNEIYRRMAQEEHVMSIIIARNDPKILRIALYAGLDIEGDHIYVKNHVGEMEYQHPTDRIFAEDKKSLIDEVFSFLSICNKKDSPLYRKCEEYYLRKGLEVPKIDSLPDLQKASYKENTAPIKRSRPGASLRHTQTPDQALPPGPRGLRF